MKDKELCGKYKSEIKYLDRIRYYESGFYTASKLLLNPDSTFNYETCKTLSNGKWKATNDSVFLHTSSIKFKIDSLKYLPKWKKYLIIPDKPTKLKIGDGKLISTHTENRKLFREVLYKK
ncbi:MAG: hypothetical protein EOP00_17425 [Pedobacter sp.]|nr:MAG: hypothetical protein EOP00_17425 [Pedobacter sp.]